MVRRKLVRVTRKALGYDRANAFDVLFAFDESDITLLSLPDPQLAFVRRRVVPCHK